MDLREVTSNWLHEWEAISKRIESIDARLWQGAGILWVISIGGISILGWNPPKTIGDFTIVVIAGLVSLAILFVWWYIFHRWIYLQGVYSYRAREIEEKLDLWLNRYARLIEHWESEEAESLGKSELREKDRAAYDKLQRFNDEQAKKRFVHFTIRNALRALTIILAIGWLLFMALYGIAYF
jgi:hypothetical protein